MVWKVEMSGSARSPFATSLSCLRRDEAVSSEAGAGFGSLGGQ